MLENTREMLLQLLPSSQPPRLSCIYANSPAIPSRCTQQLGPNSPKDEALHESTAAIYISHDSICQG
jgi:hypothetical protein